jgi:hypothetical protein
MIFNPGISGVPEARASVARSGDWAAAGANIAERPSAAAIRRANMV